MTTAQKVVNNALRLINLNSNFKGADPYHQQVGFEVLVDWLQEQRGSEIYITPQIPASINSDIKEPAWAKKGIEYALAYDLIAPLQVKEVPPTLMSVKDSSFNKIYYNAKPNTDQQYPDTLPVGGGNQQDYTWAYRFYSRFDGTVYEVSDSVNYGEIQTIYADFDADATLKNTAVASVEWRIASGVSSSLTNETITNNLASTTVEFLAVGTTKIVATATYADGQKKDFAFQFEVNRI